MYKITGADGREYGPITLEQLIEWVRQGRVSPQTRVQVPGATDWKPASEIVELQGVLGQMRGTAPPRTLPAGAPAIADSQDKALAITSLVLGILSIICLGPLAGLPAIICGHIAHNRARRSPAQYGGSGLAIAGFVTGYAGLLVGLVLASIYAAMLLPALARAKGRAQEINCMNNMKMVGLAFKTWAIDHQDECPFNVSTNKGGTFELCRPGPDGFDQNSWMHFLVLSNELSTPKILVCPAGDKQPAPDWAFLQSSNVTYLVRSGPSVNFTNPQAVLAVCPIHNHRLLADGSVQRGGLPSQRGARGKN